MKQNNIKESEDLYKVLFESVHDGIYRSTPDGRIITANPALVQMLGYDSEEELKNLNIGKDIYVFQEERDALLHEIENKGKLRDTELVLRKKDGTTIIVIENSHAVTNKEGDILFYEGTLTEITERKRAEQALMESENRYHTLIETMQDGISLFDFNGNLLYANSQKRKMLGYKDDAELLKVNVFDMIHPDDRKIAQKSFKILSAKGAISNLEIRVLRNDGSFFIAEFNATILNDSNGDPAYIMDSMRDITGRRKAEEQLMLLKHSIDSHYDGAFWMDNKCRYVYVNNAACKDTGYSKEELLGMHISIMNPQFSEEVAALIWDKLRKDGSFTSESIHKRKDGSLYPVEIVTTYITYGGIEYACGFARDITERKKAAEDIKQRLDQLRQIIDLVPSYIFAKDIDGKFILANKALADIFGLPPDEIQGKFDEDMGVGRELVEWYRKNDMEVIRTGKPVHIPEEKVLRKDGKLGWFQTVKIPYKHPGYDKPAILGVATEITERKQVEDELKKSELRFRKLFESHTAVKMLIDPDTLDIIDANKAAVEYLGWSASKIRKMNLSEITSIRPSELKQIFETGSPKQGFEAPAILADGSERVVEVYNSRIEIDGSYYIHAIIHDITEKKKILCDLIVAKEKAEESDRLKTAFLHNISHEIRTPMNAIVGFTSLLESSELSEENRRQYIDIVFQSSSQLLSIITDIVDISNIETGHVKISPVESNIKTLLKKIYDQFRLRAETMNLEFGYSTSIGDDKAKVMADETKIIQVISNLLNNAFKFTEHGKITFGCDLKGKEIEFFVKDTGKGIKPEFTDKIFDRFYQIDGKVSRKTEGTGLGLSICKGYVELMGGKIKVKSTPGKGSVFSFTIPYVKGRRKTGAASETKNIIPEKTIRDKTILVAEDDEVSFKLIHELLSENNITILRAHNGEEAVNIYRENKNNTDLIIMDLKMPVKDGFTAAHEIREINASIPVIALTAYVEEGDREKVLNSGFNAYLAKPITKKELIKILMVHL